jgi:hypothetical protein
MLSRVSLRVIVANHAHFADLRVIHLGDISVRSRLLTVENVSILLTGVAEMSALLSKVIHSSVVGEILHPALVQFCATEITNHNATFGIAQDMFDPTRRNSPNVCRQHRQGKSSRLVLKDPHTPWRN